MTKLAILDIGTNSIHLVLAEVDPGGSYKILDRYKDMTRLGDGAFSNHKLSDAAIARGLEVIRNLVTLARNKGYDRIHAVATSAVREARNGGEFIEEIFRQTGLTVQIITGQEEARLIYLGVLHSIGLSERLTLIVDVGGGSVELIVGNRDTMSRAESLKLGAIRLKDLYLRKDPPTRSMLRDMHAVIDQQLKAALRRIKVKKVERLVGTAGMIGNLTEVIYLRRTGRPVSQLNLTTITLKEILRIEQLLMRSSLKARLAIPGLDSKRADTLLPAAAVLRTLMEQTEQEDLTTCDKAIREGLIYDFIQRHQEGLRAEHEIPDVRRRHVIFLARRCQYPQTHSHHVAKLALRLFDQTQELHKLGECEREWLEFAAILHDIGYLIHSRQHHKHAYYLIKNSDLDGLTADEVEMIANIARYHRRALPRTKHEPLKSMSSKSLKTLEKISALLRIADGLDRGHFSVIETLDVLIGKPVIIQLHTAGDPELEVWAAQSRTDLFQKIFRRSIEFTVHHLRGGRT
ncbi:MAG: HD domain-containing protein [Nitrospiraceae bacterium]